jgi:hypothetical protein
MPGFFGFLKMEGIVAGKENDVGPGHWIFYKFFELYFLGQFGGGLFSYILKVNLPGHFCVRAIGYKECRWDMLISIYTTASDR